MPEIDNDTFQVIALALSGLALLVSLVVLSTVSKLRKDLADQASRSGGHPVETGRAAAGAPITTQAAAPVAAAEPAVEAAAASPAPAGQTAGSAAQAEPTQEIAAAPAQAEVPEEQPFERDGRWWFKRGDELLVYDETSGQWEPAPAGARPGGGAPVVDTAYTPISEAAPSGGAGDPASAAPADSGMWKCPSCGAVNGATAASCRMCFTARP